MSLDESPPNASSMCRQPNLMSQSKNTNRCSVTTPCNMQYERNVNLTWKNNWFAWSQLNNKADIKIDKVCAQESVLNNTCLPMDNYRTYNYDNNIQIMNGYECDGKYIFMR